MIIFKAVTAAQWQVTEEKDFCPQNHQKPLAIRVTILMLSKERNQNNHKWDCKSYHMGVISELQVSFELVKNKLFYRKTT